MSEIYDIYHDESREESYWHGFLFVPRNGRQYLLDLLTKAREGIKWDKPISFKEINNRTSRNSPRVQLVESWLSIALASLQQKKLFNLPTSCFLCGHPRQYIYRLEELIKCKFVVFKERDKHKKMFAGLSGLDCIETTFRMGIKGGIHRLFNEKDSIIIGNIFIDGDKHYIKFWGRRFDVNRSLRRFAIERRPYVSFIRGAKLIPQTSNHRKIKPTQKTEDSQFLQICDILLGGIRFHSFCPNSQHTKHRISLPCRALLERDTKNYFRMKQSRFFNAFTLGEAWIEDEHWKFAPLKLGEDKVFIKNKKIQLSLNLCLKNLLNKT